MRKVIETNTHKKLSGRRSFEETRRVAERIRNLALKDSMQHVIDIGCGDGTLLAMLPEGINRVGLMPHDDEVAQLRKLHPGIKFVQGLAQSVPLPDRSFDACILHGVLPVIRGGNALHLCLSECARILLPGGKLWLGDVLCQENSEFKVLGSRNLGLLRIWVKSGELPLMRHCRREFGRLNDDNIFPAQSVAASASALGLKLVSQWPSVRYSKKSHFVTPIRRDFLLERTT